MKNNVKNALNALGLLVFMVLAWATQKARPIQVLKMEVAINADSTAFLLKNLEDIPFENGTVNVARTIDKTGADTLFALTFIQNSLAIEAKGTLIVPFGKLIGTNRASKQDTFSKRFRPESFRYFVPLPKDVDGLFTFDF